ncbi:hypothetical protein MNBD_ALPHA06-221 [hydrothermal vent metagenome]|uniref:Amidohydrolase-related domain-containing protein n=1 Tax=hydrothermal vent metagenome TaxID=652676 RepID=A0A3B0RBQ5_9ZZZZ
MTRIFASILAILLLQSAALAKTIAITGGKVITNQNGKIIENGTVLIRDDEIIAVGAANSVTIPDGASRVDATGKWVTPGLFVPFSRAGLVEVALEKSTNDTSANEALFSVALQAKDSFNPRSENIAITKIEGITRMAILPNASNTIYGGQGSLVNTSGSFSSVMDRPGFVFVQMGERGARIAGGSRSAAWAWFRQSLREAKAWRRGREPAEPLLSEADAVALQQAMANELPFLVAVERASDLMTLIALKQEFRGINLVAVGATEGWMVAEQLRGAAIPVIVDPHDNLPQSFESLGATMYNAKRLNEAGVTVAIASLRDASFNVRLAPQHAGNTLATGLSWDAAFAAITTGPAEIFGVADELGKLAPGFVADVVIWDGDPLELMSSPDAIWIDGIQQSMQTRQTKLRDRYMGLAPANDLPFAYQ